MPLQINSANGCTMPGAREVFTYSLMLKYKQYFIRETFEVMPLNREIDIILLYWWIAKYQCNRFWGEPEDIVLDSEFQKKYCTKAAV
jgi:hypothetical protein